MKTNLSDLYRTDARKACRLALRRTARLPERERIDACNALLETFGVEGIRGNWQNGYWADIVATYCNTGDTYALTVLQVRPDWSGGRSRFVVTSWGDFVERNAKRLGIS